MPQRTILLASICLILLLTDKPAIGDTQKALASGWVELANGFKVEIEIAATSTQREQGLMHRNVLGENHGMLFVYPTVSEQAMWMKNMRLALDVIFISEQGKILSILSQLPPCQKPPCPVYLCKDKAKYMLEVNSGFAARQQLAAGQELIIDYSHVIKPNR